METGTMINFLLLMLFSVIFGLWRAYMEENE